jgi:hypothetical protein
MKIKGQDLIDFFREWPPGDGVYYDDVPFSERDTDDVLCDEDERPVKPAVTYEVNGGMLGWQGDGPEPADFDDDFERVLKRWVKSRTTATIILEVPKDEKNAAMTLLKERGWKVKS